MNQYCAYNIINELYFSGEGLNNENEILQKYSQPEEGIGTPIELPDRISNINGNHIYKLISSKDIDFNNILLPNSVVDESNWGSFDVNRRWPSSHPIHINDDYELLNVIDYLLCATEDLWSEINKLKYGSTIIATMWYLNNLNQPINSIYKLDSSQFTKNSNYEITLNPETYYSTLPSSMDNFGIGTHFYDDDHENYPIRRRVISSQSNRNGINAYINYEDHSNYYRMQTENVNGNIVNIYGYKIGKDLHFYPMYNIENFFYNNRNESIEDLVDVVNRKLKYDIYFRQVVVEDEITTSKFKKVYVDFLYNNFDDCGYPYILYFIGDNNKRNIIYIHVTTGNSAYKSLLQVSTDLKKYDEYINYFYNIDSSVQHSLSDLGEELIVYRVDNGTKYPYLYYTHDNGHINLFVETPNTSNFSITNETLPINYYKNSNNLSISIKLDNNIINSSDDTEQQNSGLLYSPERYNIPDNNDISIEVTGKYLSNNQNIKFDDEYIDILLKPNKNGLYVTTDEEAARYYYYSHLDDNTNQRIFVQFNSADELNNFYGSDTENAIKINDIDQNKCAHVYIKNEDAYQLKYDFVTNSLIKQITDYSLVKSEVNNIKDITTLVDNNDSYTLNFNYKLPDQVEQLKFDINLYVDETSKVHSNSINIPISLNKIHQPCIQFVSKDIMEQEYKDYTDYLTYTFGDDQNDILHYYKYTNKNTGSFLTKLSGEAKTNQNTIQGDNPADQFNTFTDLFTYVLEKKYNNFEMDDANNVSVRTDILYHINNDSQMLSIKDNLESTFEEQFTYDNTINGSKELYISYHPQQCHLNLIGSYNLFRNYLNNNLQSTCAYIENVKYNTQSNTQELIPFNTIFMINGLGFNYRLHGGDNYLYINRDGGPLQQHRNRIDLPFDNQFDLMTTNCINDNNNVVKFMELSITDDNNQFNDITINGSNVTTDKFLENNIIDIYASSYMYKVQCDSDRLLKKRALNYNYTQNLSDIDNWSSTYYSPITYMHIKNTTFYPSENILPEEKYNLNNNEDYSKYLEYMEFWNSDDETNKYKPIILSVKLNNNKEGNIPFFYESNTAKVKFDIHRLDPSKINSEQYVISGKTLGQDSGAVYLAIGQRYYISDFMNINALSNKQLGCIGSYPLYNETTQKFDIREIYECKSDSQEPISIPKVNNEYKYELTKVAKLNKIKFKDPIFGASNIADESYIDYDKLYWFETNDDLLESIGTDIINKEFTLSMSVDKIYGNKLYKNISASSTPLIRIRFLYRTIPTVNLDNIIIKDTEGNDVITNHDLIDNGFSFVTGRDGENQLTSRFKHATFYQIENNEILTIPNISDIDNYYIYDGSAGTSGRMIQLSQMTNFRTQDLIIENYTEFYNTLKSAFKNNNIYQLIS